MSQDTTDEDVYLASAQVLQTVVDLSSSRSALVGSYVVSANQPALSVAYVPHTWYTRHSREPIRDASLHTRHGAVVDPTTSHATCLPRLFTYAPD